MGTTSTNRRSPVLTGAAHPRRRSLRRAGVALAVSGLLAIAAACAPAASTPGSAANVAEPEAPTGTGTTAPSAPTTPGTTPGTAPRPAGPFSVHRSTVTLVDRTRPTEAGAATPEKPERTLETTLWVPDATGPFPLIVFSHGLGGHPDKFTELLGAWARAGFVVAAPAFPLTNDRVPSMSKNWTGLAQQPNDVRFVIGEALRLADDPTSELYHRIMPDQIGAGGLSLGGATTYGVVFNDCCRDPRIKSAEVLSGAQLPVGGGSDNKIDGHVPLLIMHGDKDAALPYASEVDTFTHAPGPVWFVTLIGGSHAPPFEDDPSPWDSLDVKVTTDFWLGTLGPGGGDPAALQRLAQDAVVPGLSSLQTK